jgi:hypothetical protein
MWGFGSDLRVGKEYKYDIVVAAVGIKGWSGRDMVFEGVGSFVAEAGDDREVSETQLEAEAIDAARKELPGAHEYLVLKFVAR